VAATIARSNATPAVFIFVAVINFDQFERGCVAETVAALFPLCSRDSGRRRLDAMARNYRAQQGTLAVMPTPPDANELSRARADTLLRRVIADTERFANLAENSCLQKAQRQRLVALLQSREGSSRCGAIFRHRASGPRASS